MQKKVLSLFNFFNNKLDNLINSPNKEDIISYCLSKNVISFELLAIQENKIVGNTKLHKKIKNLNGNIFDLNFLH